MKFMKKIPGGFVIVPLILGMLINTMFPLIFEIGGPFGALFKNGNQALMGVFLMVCGALIKINQIGEPLYKGTLLLVLKLVLGGLAAWGFSYAFGNKGILGLTPFALFCALPSNNSGLYLALSAEYGNETDIGAVSVLSLKNGPFGSMIIMGLSGQANIPLKDLMGVVLPILIGFIWGNLDEEFKKICAKMSPVIMFLMTFSIGANSNPNNLLNSGVSGLLLALISIVLGIIIQYIYNLFLKKKTPLGVAMGASAANSAATPALIAASDPVYAPQVATVTAQCATASIVTMLVVPVLVNFYSKKIMKKELAKEQNKTA